MKAQTDARAHGMAVVAKQHSIFENFDISVLLLILKELIPILIDCFAPEDGVQAQDYVNKRFDESKRSNKYGGYKRSLARSMARQAIRAGRRKGIRLSWNQSRQLAIVALDDVRTGDTGQASIAISENFNAAA